MPKRAARAAAYAAAAAALLAASAGAAAAPTAGNQKVRVFWKPQRADGGAAGLARELDGVLAFGAGAVSLYCGHGPLANGSFGVVPDPPQRWGVATLCAPALRLLAARGVPTMIMASARSDFPGLAEAVALGGDAFGGQARAVLEALEAPLAASRMPPLGLDLDFERGKDKAAPIPSAADFAAFTGGVKAALNAKGGKPRRMDVCVDTFCSFLSDYALLTSKGGADSVTDMGLYHAGSRAEFASKLAASVAAAGASAPATLAAGISLYPQGAWENSTASATERLDVLSGAGVRSAAVFVWPTLDVPGAASPDLKRAWQSALSRWAAAGHYRDW